MSWDFIIVGAGSAGCALAYNLTRSSANKRILVLEAGGNDRSPLIRVPAGQIKAIAKYDWGYKSQPDASRNGSSENWQRGKVLGGSSSINGTMYVRGSAEDFDRWNRGLGNAAHESWAARDILPLYQELEASDQNGLLRGQTGQLYVRTVQHPHRLTRSFVDSAQKAGHTFNSDYNNSAQEGVSFAQLSQKGRFRCSAADAFLRPAIRTGQVDVRLHAEVQRVLLSSGKATGVEFLINGIRHQEDGEHIILAAGAINSPKLLMLSGIGRAGDLHKFGIPVVADLPGVGQNLRDHPLLKLVYRTRIHSYNLTGGLLQKASIGLKYLFENEGPLANLFEAAAFLRTTPDIDGPDIQLHFLPVGYSAENGEFRLAPYPSVTVLLNKSHPASSGQVRLASPNPADAPLIECALLRDRGDLETMMRGIQLVRKIMNTDPIAALIEDEEAPGTALQSENDLETFVRRFTGIAYHPIGTCKMGTDKLAVVDPNLKVRDVANLWVADASIMPDLISGNTNAACIMIGVKLGKHLAHS